MENQTDDKVKLTVDEQITDMRTKNVQFEIVPETHSLRIGR